MPDTLLRVKEAASRLGLTESTIRQKILHKTIEHVHIGGAVRIPESAIARIIEAGRVPALEVRQ
jgi:excisionase family DNA binding protein